MGHCGACHALTLSRSCHASVEAGMDGLVRHALTDVLCD